MPTCAVILERKTTTTAYSEFLTRWVEEQTSWANLNVDHIVTFVIGLIWSEYIGKTTKLTV